MHIKLDPLAKQAFATIEKALVNITYFNHPCDNSPLTLRTDASDTAIGAILEQQGDDGTEVFRYFSKTQIQSINVIWNYMACMLQ